MTVLLSADFARFTVRAWSVARFFTPSVRSASATMRSGGRPLPSCGRSASWLPSGRPPRSRFRTAVRRKSWYTLAAFFRCSAVGAAGFTISKTPAAMQAAFEAPRISRMARPWRWKTHGMIAPRSTSTALASSRWEERPRFSREDVACPRGSPGKEASAVSRRRIPPLSFRIRRDARSAAWKSSSCPPAGPGRRASTLPLPAARVPRASDSAAGLRAPSVVRFCRQTQTSTIRTGSTRRRGHGRTASRGPADRASSG